MRHILVTGASGVIGSALVPALLEEPETRVHLVLRAESEAHLRERTQRLLARWGAAADTHDSEDRVRSHRGDVTLPQLGLSGAAYERLVRETTHVVHCAGNVRLNQSRGSARRDAVSAARAVVEFARESLARGRLEKVDVTSTVGVAGRCGGVVPEQRLTEPRRFRNTYEEAKAEAEEVCWRAIDRGLPLTVHRPSMVVGDSRSGEVSQFQVFYHLVEFLVGKYTAGALPRFGGFTLDIVPVDFVARALALSSQDVGTAGRVFHLCSGPLAVPLEEVAERYAAFCQGSGESLPRQRTAPRWLVRSLSRVAPLFVRGRAGRRLRTVPYFLAYLGEPQAFEVERTRAYFHGRGCAAPAPAEYLGRVFAYYREHHGGTG
jgi:UDP-glucose 4-epimerase